MAVIPINDKYRIKSSSQSWDIQRFKPATDTANDSWQSFKYYGTLGNAIQGLYELELRGANTQTLAELREFAEDLAHTLSRAHILKLEVS